MHEGVIKLFRSYFQQRMELGDKIIYKPFDTEMPEPILVEETTLSIDDFRQTESLDELYQTINECQRAFLAFV